MGKSQRRRSQLAAGATRAVADDTEARSKSQPPRMSARARVQQQRREKIASRLRRRFDERGEAVLNIAERLARERQRPSIFYVCVSNGASVVAEACVAAGGYPALWRSCLAERCSPARPRWIEHSGSELGVCLAETHRADLLLEPAVQEVVELAELRLHLQLLLVLGLKTRNKNDSRNKIQP